MLTCMSQPAAGPPRRDRLPWDYYVEALRLDAERLAEVAGMGLEPSVPSCPGWTVADLVQHTAVVYLHKIESMRTGGAPQDWPPPGIEDRDPRELYTEAARALLAELVSHDPAEACDTWWPPDRTVGFWYRRMALETAVHRVDAELGHDVLTPVDDALALDGTDEVLRIMLQVPWALTQPSAEPVNSRVRLSSTGRSWTVTLSAEQVLVDESDSTAVPIEIAGSPDDLFLWLWGRRNDAALAVTGEADVAAAFRRRVASVT